MRHNARFLIENLLKHTISEAPGHLQSPNTLIHIIKISNGDA